MNIVLYYALVGAATLFLAVQALIFAGTKLNNPVFTFYGRSLASFVALLLCATYGTIASALLNITGHGGLGQWTTARSFKWTMLLFTGVWFEIEDPEDYLGKTRPAVFVGNHQTELDVLALGHIFPPYCSVTAKKSLKMWPFLGWFMAMSKTVFIERASREQAVAAFAQAAEQMHSAKQSVFLFPEGTRSYYTEPDLLSFKKGAFHLAVQAQVPIVPVVVANYSHVLNVKKKSFNPGTIAIRVLKPIDTKGKTKENVDALLEETRTKMLAAIKELGVTHNAALKEGSGKANGVAKSTGVDMRH